MSFQTSHSALILISFTSTFASEDSHDNNKEAALDRSSRDCAVGLRILCKPGRQVAIVDLFLDQPVFHRPRLFLDPGNLGLELLVLILEMAQAGLHLARRRFDVGLPF